MKTFLVQFEIPQYGSCFVEAENADEAFRKVDGKTWKQLWDFGYDPEIDDSKPVATDKVDAIHSEPWLHSEGKNDDAQP